MPCLARIGLREERPEKALTTWTLWLTVQVELHKTARQVPL